MLELLLRHDLRKGSSSGLPSGSKNVTNTQAPSPWGEGWGEGIESGQPYVKRCACRRLIEPDEQNQNFADPYGMLGCQFVQRLRCNVSWPVQNTQR